ncbi:MAG: S9 family peptidase [Geminicoccaceae bacterium]
MAETAAYGHWASPITPETLTVKQVGLAAPRLDRGTVLWLESRPEEQGRQTVRQYLPDGYTIERTPAPFNIRSRVHEYGGGAYTAHDGIVYAVGFEDQRIWRFEPGTSPSPLTPESEGRLRYADLQIDIANDRLIAVREDHRGAGEPKAAIVGIALDGGAHEGRVLVDGDDFYAHPRPSEGGTRLAFIAWNHPNMPWDGTELRLADLDDDGGVTDIRVIAGGREESVTQPQFAPDGTLFFISDRSGWWNLWRLSEGGPVSALPIDADFARGDWQFGNSDYGFLPDGSLLGLVTLGGEWKLWRLAHGEEQPDLLDLPYRDLSHLHIEGKRAVMLAASPDRPSALLGLDLEAGGAAELAKSGETPVPSPYLARPETVLFPTDGGREVHAFYYPPTNPEFAAPEGERPPLIVRAHGGPTSAAHLGLRLATQFWTSRGFGFLDVNYGGSTGFGRAYRQRLKGQWGVVDVQDIAAGARFMVEDARADADKLLVTGSSAGGYTTLCALTFTNVFAGGSSHYGISDLRSLATDTHKFESRYLDSLVGPWPDAKAIYEARSPLIHADRLACPVIFFQGSDDRIVPPDQAERLAKALQAKGVRHELHVYPGEAHGFRRAETIHQVLRSELAFFQAIIAG